MWRVSHLELRFQMYFNAQSVWFRRVNLFLMDSTSPAMQISHKGIRYLADFAFFNVVSIRGYILFLILVEEDSGYQWVFTHCSKHLPI